jgi:hypothetical protein
MSHAATIAAIRLKAVQALGQFLLTDGQEPREAILLKAGIYCGRRFQAERGSAVWNADNDDLQVFRGETILTVIHNASASTAANRSAA